MGKIIKTPNIEKSTPHRAITSCSINSGIAEITEPTINKLNPIALGNWFFFSASTYAITF
ncbi:hypothetical protein GCM10027180_24820 [Microbulbifer echini]